MAAQRRDFSHKLSRSLVDRFTHIAFENLNIKGLAAGMFAKSVHNAAWNQRQCPHCHTGVMVVIDCVALPRVRSSVIDTS